jgi:Flp pilus assembly protein TadD
LIGSVVTQNEKAFTSAIHTAVDLMNQPEKALEFTQERLLQSPDSTFALNMHGWALIANKNFDEAEIVLNQALKLEPDSPRTYLNLGLLHEELEDFERAKKMYQQAYQLGQKNPALSSLTNLAAEQYNTLTQQTNPVERSRPENSP